MMYCTQLPRLPFRHLSIFSFNTEIRISCVGGESNPHLFVTIEKRIIAVRVTWSMTTAHNVLSIELPRKIAETGFEPVTSGA